MLSKKNRFFGPHPVRALQRHGSSARHGSFSIKYQAPRFSPAETKIAVIVSKKVDKRAVVRNRIRRRVFESIRKNWQHLEHPIEISIGVFNAQAADMPHKEIESEIQSLLAKADVWKSTI